MVKGQKAGTALRTMFTNLAKPTKAMKNQMEELGITITDSNGEMLPMRDVLDQLREKFSGLSKDQQASAAATIFGKEAMSGALAVINASESDYTKLSKAIDKSEGSATAMSKTMESGLGGSLRELRSAAEELGLSIFESVQPALKGMVSGLKNTVDYLNGLPKGAKLAAVGFGVITAAIGPLLLGTGLLIRGIGSAMKGYAGLNRVMAKNSVEAGINAAAQSTVGTAMMTTNSKGAKASKGIGKLSSVFGLGTKSIKGFGGMLLKGVKGFGPWGLALTAITTALGIAYSKVDWFREGVNGAGETIKVFTKKLGGSLLTGIKNLGNWVGDLGTKFKKTWEDSEIGQETIKGYGKLKDATKGVFKELSKGNKKATDTVNVLGKGVSKGTKKALGEYVKLSEGTIKEFEKVKINGGKINKETQKDLSTSIYQTGKEASKVVKERAREIQNNLKEALSYSESLSEEDKQNIITRSNKAGKVKLEKVNALNEEINKLTMEAYQDGEISPEEQKLIQKKEEERNELVIGYATKGEAERQAIISRMRYNAEGLSNQEISKALKEAYKIEEDEIKKAAKKRDEALQAANASLKDKSINKNEHRSIVLDIESEYNDAVDKAKKKSGEVRDTVKKGNKDIAKEMDLSNGHVYTGAEKLWKNFVSDFKKYWGSGTAIDDTLNGWYDGYVKKASKIGYDIIDWIGKGLSSSYEKNKEALSNVGLMIWSPIKSGWNSTTKWVSEKTDTAKGWLTGVSVKAGNLWEDVKNVTSTTFANLTQETKTKFGGMYKNSAGWLGKTAGTALGKFTGISSNATKWLGKATGTAISKFQSISKGAGDWLGKASGTAAGKFSSISSSAAKWLGKTAGTAKDKFTNVSSSAGKWLGKTAGTATSKFTTVWNSAKDRFNRTRDKAESSTKSVSKSAGKWFGSAAGTAKSRFGEIWGSAKSNFTNVAEHGWNKAKSTYNGFKTWLGRTLKYIRDIGSDMGRAASDLGIKVANNAIEGLNKMIAGVNKISAAITGDNLIKTIDTIGSAGTLGRRLSTGTVGSDVSTDSDGALKQATMAIVNDKGPGNGTGGFTQEIIERKDGSMYMPKGKDVPVMLEPGSKVHSGSVTQQLAKLGLLPKFSTGTPRKKRLDEQLVGAFGKLTGKTVGHGAEALDGIGTLTDKAKGEAGKQVGKASAFVSKSVKDVWDFVDKPKELIKRVMNDFGVNFKNIPAHTGELVRGAYKKLKSSLADKVTSMFAEFGSSGGGYNPFADWPITPGRGWKSGGHAGIDYAVPAGTKIPSPLDGEVIQRWFSPYGGGNETQVYDGSKYTHIFMHQSKQIAKKGQRINQGDTIGLVGNTGNSFGAHLHWQVNKGKGFRNNHPDSINPLDWVKEAMAAGGAGGKGAAYARKIIKQAQNILGGRYKSPAITEHMMKLAKRESNFDPKAVNNWDSNAQRGTPSKGMFQMIEPTFRANAKSGYTKFGNTLHEAISSLQYIVRTYGWGGFPRAASAAYANGGISSTHKIAQISEGNKAEAIVPLTKRTRAIQLTEQIMDYLGMDTGKSNVTVNNDTSVMEKLLKQIVVLNDRSNKQTDVIIKMMKHIPRGAHAKDLEPIISTLQGNRLNNANYTMGGAR
ncbi:phage tail tape measure protein [Mammaliicoccus sp. E-M25]|uniref:phage tail tape measure protein n=1 Tax=Mammaliicoccus sp. E-M25 TaxID=2898685 RepID=UPI001EFBEDCA|nr:phage tail tape measure protein [Mammaliicoccus sp. E-M25]